MKVRELLESNSFDEAKFRKDCEYYFKLKGTSTLEMYHGSESDSFNINGINAFRPRTRSKDSPSDLHNRANEFFEEEFTHPFRNGLFVTSAALIADGYGKLYTIVPVGHFEWLCDLDMKDMYKTYEKLVKEPSQEEYDRATEEVLDKMLEDRWYNNSNLFDKCLESGNEIMLWCPNGFYVFDTHNLPANF